MALFHVATLCLYISILGAKYFCFTWLQHAFMFPVFYLNFQIPLRYTLSLCFHSFLTKLLQPTRLATLCLNISILCTDMLTSCLTIPSHWNCLVTLRGELQQLQCVSAVFIESVFLQCKRCLTINLTTFARYFTCYPSRSVNRGIFVDLLWLSY